MPRDRRSIAPLFAALLLACRAQPSAPPDEPAGGVLIAAHGSLFIRDVAPAAKRGDIFLVASHETIPGTRDRPLVGLVRGLQRHGRHLAVAEECPIPARERPVLTGVGLLAYPLAEDTRPRVKNCLARYSLRLADWDPARARVDLNLDVGAGDDVREGDRYTVLGEPIADGLNQRVTGFEPVGQCVVQQPIGEGYAVCRLDRRQWPGLTRERAIAGGYALLRRAAPE